MSHIVGIGLGMNMFRQAEQAATKRGCWGTFLNTATFQARTFYEQLGYEIFGTLEDDPRARNRYYMRRYLKDGS